MEWINKNLYDNYVLVGDMTDHIIKLYIIHPNGIKIIKEKHMSQHDIDNCDLDNIRRYFSKNISKIESMTEDQLQSYCGAIKNEQK